jgi:hypothetical protein
LICSVHAAANASVVKGVVDAAELFDGFSDAVVDVFLTRNIQLDLQRGNVRVLFLQL